MKEIVFLVDGMTCSACSSGIERSLRRKEGIQTIEVNLIQKTARVLFDESLISQDKIFDWITKLGYTPSFENFKQKDKGSVFKRLEDKILTPKRRVLLAIILSFIILYLSMGMMFSKAIIPEFLQIPKINAFLQLFIALSVMHLGRQFFIKGFLTLWHKNPNMDSLIAIGSGVSFVYSVYEMFFITSDFLPHLYFESVCVILTFVLIGKTLENYAKNKSIQTLDTLEQFYQQKTLVLREGKYEEINIKDVVANSILKVLPGSLIPADGEILEGKSEVDESMLSGENTPVVKDIGMSVVSGSINLSQSLIIQTKKDSKLSTMAQIYHLAKKAQEGKAPIARFADKVSGVFVPSVLILACVVSAFWWYFSDFKTALNVFVSILLVSCPCALGLATPMAILIGTIKGLKSGVLFKNASVLENAHKVDWVIFDKTGTLTESNLEVSKVLVYSQTSSENQILSIAKTLEENSQHLIAQAILEQTKDIQTFLCDEIVNEVGLGISGKVSEILYKIGKKEFFKTPLADEEKGQISVFVGREIAGKEEVLGVIFLRDRIKPQAQSCIKFLKDNRIKTMILSGDNEFNVKRIAKELGVDDFKAGLRPQDKLKYIQSLKDNGCLVMMVGDGLNDAPALALADVSLSMGVGSNLSKEKSDIIILNNQILSVANVVRLSQKVLKNIKGNLFWAFFYNIIAILFACGIGISFGLVFNPMFAAFAMSFSSLCVVLNAQRLYRFKFL